MARFSVVLGLVLITALVSVAAAAAAASGGGDQFEAAQMGWMMMPMRSEELVGGDEEEFELDSESNRRILATTRYISYGALQRNSVPCSRRGQSYYNCRPGAPANPYSRGCSAITRCRS